MTSTRAFRNAPNERTTFLPRFLGTRGAVACENYLAAQAGADVMKAGGNAVDAAVTTTLVESLTNPHMFTVGGECPMLICMAGKRQVVAVNGNTVAPAAATPQAYRDRNLADVAAEGILSAGVPAAFGALVTALARFGRMPFAEVAEPAISLARDGFPVHRGLIAQEKFGLRDLREKFLADWPGSARLYLPSAEVPKEGQVLRNDRLADMLASLAAIERKTRGRREKKLSAVFNGFYRGDVAAEIDRFSKGRGGLLARRDLALYQTRIEEPARLNFGDITVFKCGAWNQGPALLQALAILEGVDLGSMGHNTADFVHWTTEALKLAYADREQYYGDPRQVDVPLPELLSNSYASVRRGLVDPLRASREMRPGDPRRNGALLPADQRLGGRAWGAGTVHVDAIDQEGNMVAFTPSGGWLQSSEVVPALGFPLGNRLMTFYLGPPHHPNVVAPFKQPRTTISPSLAFLRGRPWMVFGSMGGDQQDQWQLQFLLNRVVFGMTIQEAIEAPKFSSEHFPGFFAPHDFYLGRVRVEPRVDQPVLEELARRGHDVDVGVDWSEGFLVAASRDPETGLIEAGCDPRGVKSEVFAPAALCW